MKKWYDIYRKYRESDLMKEFRIWLLEEQQQTALIEVVDIQTIWGWLICFAETKGIHLEKGLIATKQHDGWIILAQDTKKKKQEEYMLWCADKFFEVAK